MLRREPGSVGTVVADAVRSDDNYIIEVEELITRLGQSHVASGRPHRGSELNVRTIVIALLACFVCLPGCAVAAAFLMATETTEPEPAKSLPEFFVKSDRLPVNDLAFEIRHQLYSKGTARFAALDPSPELPAPVIEDNTEMLAIRGRIEEAPPAASSPTLDQPLPARVQAPRVKRETRRPRPFSVAQSKPVLQPPQPSLIERLFSMRFLPNPNPPQT